MGARRLYSSRFLSTSASASTSARARLLRSRLAEEAPSPQDFVAGSPRPVVADHSAGRSDHSAVRAAAELRRQHGVPAAEASTSVDPALSDRFSRRHTYLRISLTERCSLRCVYCMPEGGVDLTPDSRLLRTEEMMRIASLLVDAGVNKIRLTGGEPTVRRDLPEIVSSLNELRPRGLRQIALTSNGIALPRMLPTLVLNGLDRLNVSLDTLDRARFVQIARRDGLARVLEAIDLALELGLTPLKLNCVVMAGINDDELLAFAELSRARPIDVRFIEYMPFDGNKWKHESMVSLEEMLLRLREAHPELSKQPSPPNDVAVSWKLPDSAGSVSFIASMTQPFCSGCNRLRLTADGSLKVCLFGSREVSLRDAMREGATDAELLELVGGALQRKHAAHAGMHQIAATKNRPMTTIGG